MTPPHKAYLIISSGFYVADNKDRRTIKASEAVLWTIFEAATAVSMGKGLVRAIHKDYANPIAPAGRKKEQK